MLLPSEENFKFANSTMSEVFEHKVRVKTEM